MAGAAPTPAQNERAFLKLLRYCEFGRLDDGDYYTLYGFGKFTDDSTHPNRRYVVGKHKDGTPIYSSPAGAYQIVYSTYTDAVQDGVVSDFKPASQDRLALWLIEKRHARDMVDAGQAATAIGKLNHIWVSLPGGSAPKMDLAQALSRFQAYLADETKAGS